MSDQNIYQIDQILLSFVRLDEVKLQEIVSYDPSKELLTELIHIFETETADVIAQIKNLHSTQSYLEISKLAHRLRSTSLNLGATRLSEMLKRIEYMTLESAVVGKELDFLINAAEKEIIFTSQQLQNFLPSGKI